MPKFHRDVQIVLRGLNAVSRAATSVTEAELKEAWTSSSSTRAGLKNLLAVNYKPDNFLKHFEEATERSFAVVKGLKEYSIITQQWMGKKITYPFKLYQDVQATEKLDSQQGMIL